MDSASVTFWGLVVGTVIGIIAGSFVQYLTQHLFAGWQQRSLLKAFKRELEYDIGVLGSLLDEVARFRTAVGSNNLNSYFGSIKLTDVFFVLSNRALSEGLLYHAIEQQNLLALQKAATFCSAASENWIATEIQSLKQGQGGSPAVFVNYLEDELKLHSKTLREIVQKINDN